MLIHIYTARIFTYFILLKCKQTEKLSKNKNISKKEKQENKRSKGFQTELIIRINMLYSKNCF